MWRTCVSTVFGVTNRRPPIPRSVSPSAISARTSRSRGVSSSRGESGPCPADEPSDELRVDDDPAFADTAHRVGQLTAVEHAVLEQVAAAFVAPLEQSERVLRFDVLREDENPDVRPARANRLCRDEALVGMRRRHADVDDGDVGRLCLDATARARSADATFATTSKPPSVSTRATPSRRSTESSATTTRTDLGVDARSPTGGAVEAEVAVERLDPIVRARAVPSRVSGRRRRRRRLRCRQPRSSRRATLTLTLEA